MTLREKIRMFHRSSFRSSNRALFAASSRALAIVELDLDGTILHANENFLDKMNYRLDEIVGRNHSVLVPPDEAGRHCDLWDSLRRGEPRSAEFHRLAKGGRDVWIQATYSPVLGYGGRPVGVIKFATDITEQKLRTLAEGAQVASLRRSQGFFRLELDGTITDANDIFLRMMGYERAEIIGQNLRMCLTSEQAASREYAELWEALRRGETKSAEYRHVGKQGRHVWIRAVYTQILGLNGKPIAVIGSATDVTKRKTRTADHKGQIEAINRSQAVIHFAMDGSVLEANRNFLDALGYDIAEVRGRNHSMFVEPDYATSAEYAEFWNKLRRGEFHSAVYRRIGKNARVVWINATYNPVFGPEGELVKVVKYASNITARMEARVRAIGFADQTLCNVQSVAAAVEEMTASSSEIAGTMMKSREVVATITRQAADADVATRRLQDVASAMDQVVQLIRTIASQINLLSLNATIESARAGEAGRGFAVVANEVKQLANQTTVATQKVAEEIQLVQSVSSEVADTLGLIGSSVGTLLQFVGAAACAVDEQNSATREISSNMQAAARDVAGISTSLDESHALAA